MELRSFHDLPSPAATPAKPEPPATGRAWLKGIAAGIKALRPGRELVAGGDVLWKPINKQAALLLAKSPEICKPQHPSIMNNKLIERIQTAEGPARIVENGHFDKLAKETDEQTRINVGNKMKKMASKMPQDGIEFAEEVRHARKVLDDATDLMRTEVVRFIEEMPKAIEKVRQWRMTIEREKDMSLRALQDIRKFFLESDHEKEMTRLSEFVRTCERLEALAKDGTLDKVAEVMLKLA